MTLLNIRLVPRLVRLVSLISLVYCTVFSPPASARQPVIEPEVKGSSHSSSFSTPKEPFQALLLLLTLHISLSVPITVLYRLLLHLWEPTAPETEVGRSRLSIH